MKQLEVNLIKNVLNIRMFERTDFKNLSLNLVDDVSSVPLTKINEFPIDDPDYKGYEFQIDLGEFLDDRFKRGLPLTDESSSKVIIQSNYTIESFPSSDDVQSEPTFEEYHTSLRVPFKKKWSLDNFHKVYDSANLHFLNVYVTKKNALAILIDQEVRPSQYLRHRMITKLDIHEKEMKIKGEIKLNYFSLLDCHVEMIERGGKQKISFPVKIKSAPIKSNKSFRYEYEVFIQMDYVLDYLKNLKQTEELSLDLFFVVNLNQNDSSSTFRVGNPKFLVDYFMKGELASFDSQNNQWYSLVPYFTLKATNLSFTFNVYDKEAYDYFRSNKNNWNSVAKSGEEKDIWIIGERSYKAQDNGYHFFKYLRENHPEINAYYVIRKNSIERRNVDPLGHVIFFNSKEHFEKVIQAKYICGTHHPDSLYPIRSKEYIKHIKAKKIFLQHGVFGTKNIAPIYAKSVNEFYTDLFITSSPKEKGIAMTDLGYSKSEVAVTGLARFDTLFKNDIKVKRQLLIIPTWRDWITNAEQFEQSEYLERYRALLFDPRLKAFSEKNNLKIIFCLHPNMQDYIDYFKDVPATLINQGKVDVQALIKESMMMLTDYSSVAFDFSFLHKPVLYYQFDRNRFLGKYPSHLDLDNELPGPIVDNLDNLFNELNNSAANNFSMEPEYVTKADSFIANRDTHSSERIYKAIVNLKNKTLKQKVQDDPLYLRIKRRFRRSKHYFPTMKKLYWIWSHTLPVKENQILFESSLGKRFEDSPRAIYEKMVENNEPYEYIWVSNNNMPLKANPDTKVIKRLSFEYYKYLATSKYWVNNQNFPTYITKRKEISYLQTWHGTPLKKMQHDQTIIEGRDDSYLKRVTHAKDQWSKLVSPSPYATSAFRSAFQYDGSVIEKGYPRNDVFYSSDSNNIREHVRKDLGIPADKKVILYAPTFRDYEKSGKKFVMENEIDFEQFEKKLGDNYVLLMRQHVIVASKLSIPAEMQHNIINVSTYPNIQELMLASDMLVTDYSSVMFDYLNVNRPMYFFTYDLEKYLDLRGVYFDFEKEVPGPIVKTSDELLNAIANNETYWDTYGALYKDFQNKFIPFDGPNTAETVYKDFFK
ncbi:CDP-glycerol glycerophosphotransferase family protein [Pediococcus stilesii]|uniref:Glycosyl glycerophosphate transferase n=1 Tax=Pediococcus stilesii TaxID=331679 RepID=A0A0R2KW63_9LACO|nr:CDP-glycerol glycerophosphotransferase family protein [Pediococcus stilesii]KRN93710.1 glycosyl glycerophosphate transferase [Pediococcus stilesii]